MAWKPFTKNIQETGVVDFIYTPSINGAIDLTEQFKGQVEQKEVKFPNELGEEHPFDFKELEELYKKFGFFTAVIDKYVDFVIGPGFYIDCEDDRAKKIIEDFIRDVNLDTLLRAWTKEALVKGNGFLEIGGSKKEGVKGLKVINANNMYVVRDKQGKVLSYNQYVGAFDKYTKQKVIPFTDPNSIAHFAFNVIGDNAYGLGIGYPSLVAINNFLQNEKDNHFIVHRKANSPLHAQLGKVDGTVKIIPKAEDVNAFGAKMEQMNNKTDWATDPLVNFKVIDFGNLGDKFNSILEHDLAMLFYIFQIPPELMGMANIPEGMAQVRMDAFERRIQSIQAEEEKIIEQQIFKRVLNSNGLDVHVEFQWGRPSNQEKADRLLRLTELMRLPMISESLFKLMEADVVKILDYNQKEYQSMSDEEERKREEERPQPLVPGENENKPQLPVPRSEQPRQPKPQESYEPQKVQIDVNVNKNEKIENEKEFNGLDNEFIIKRDDEFKEFMKTIINQISLNPQNRQEINIEDIENKLRKEFEEKLEKLKELEKVSNTEINKEEKQEIKLKKNKLIKLKKRESIIPNSKELKSNYKKENSELDITEDFDSINDVEEWLGFSYKKYLQQIHNALETYDFNQIRALTEAEHMAGYLSDVQVEEVRKILDNGFKKGLGIREMSKQVDKIGLKDLYRMTEDGQIKTGASGLPILAKSADKRSIGIVRSEVTRMANKGAVDYYKQNGVEKVRWVASIGARTCPECEALSGQIFDVNSHPEIPVHSMCRCTLAPFVELK